MTHAQTGVIGGLSIGVIRRRITNAYGSIPNKGVFNDAYMIRRITDAHGNFVYKHEQSLSVYFPSNAFSDDRYAFGPLSRIGPLTAHSILQHFRNYGEIPIAGKTGSTQSYGDVWFMVLPPDITLRSMVRIRDASKYAFLKTAIGHAPVRFGRRL